MKKSNDCSAGRSARRVWGLMRFSLMTYVTWIVCVRESFAQSGTIRWKFATHGEIHSPPAVTTNGTIYVGSWDARLYALNPDGTKKWEFLTNNRIDASPVIGSDGTIYAGSDDNNLYAITPDGTQLWKFPTGNSVYADPAIGQDGTIYVASDDGNLYAVSANGSQKWKFATGGRVPSPSIGSDGTVYIGSTAGFLYALKPDGTVLWKYKTSRFQQVGFGPITSTSCVIDADGTIIVDPITDAGSYFERLFANGTVKQSLNNIFFQTVTGLVMGPGGSLYACDAVSLKAVYGNGSPRWSFAVTGDRFTDSGYSSGVPAVAADGTVYFYTVGGNAGSGIGAKVYAVDIDGNEKWETTTGGRFLSNPTIGPDGTIYIGSDDKTLYALKGTSPGATNVWSMYRKNASHTGSMEAPKLTQSELSLGMYPGVFIKGNVADSYRIEYSDDLKTPQQWQFLANVTLDRTPFFFVDVNATGKSRRFYRAALLPPM